jgi:thiamine pyrophosphokinase
MRYIPDLIKGDLDSLREDVREYYSAKVCIFEARTGRTFSQLLREYLFSKIPTKTPRTS